jgi:hypothetical protein
MLPTGGLFYGVVKGIISRKSEFPAITLQELGELTVHIFRRLSDGYSWAHL